jgi:hypothetical protein
LAAVMSLQVLAAGAADILPSPPPVRPIEFAQQATTSYLDGLAVLLAIRATFNVIDRDEIEPRLVADLERVSSKGPSAAQVNQLELNLLAEGSYYLVSLEYVVRAGGAAWPDDRPAANYDNDAIVLTDSLKRRLADAVESGADSLPIFVEAQKLMALTNGEKDIPPAEDLFGRRDAMVERALAQAAPWTRT